MIPTPYDCEFEELAGKLQFDAGFSRIEAERLAKEKPWQTDPHYWDMIAAAMDIFEVNR